MAGSPGTKGDQGERGPRGLIGVYLCYLMLIFDTNTISIELFLLEITSKLTSFSFIFSCPVIMSEYCRRCSPEKSGSLMSLVALNCLNEINNK